MISLHFYENGLAVGNGGYYSKASGNKWVATTKINTTTIKNSLTQKPSSGKGTKSTWTTSRESWMTSVG